MRRIDDALRFRPFTTQGSGKAQLVNMTLNWNGGLQLMVRVNKVESTYVS